MKQSELYLLLLFSGLPGLSFSMQSCDILTLMPADQRRASGIERLSEDEVKVLNQWFLNYCSSDSGKVAESHKLEMGQSSRGVLVEEGTLHISSYAAFGLEHKLSNQVTDMNATVVAAVKTPRGRFMLTLDNGQKWQQRETKKIKVNIGDQIRITPGIFGSYDLQHLATKRLTKVRRIE